MSVYITITVAKKLSSAPTTFSDENFGSFWVSFLGFHRLYPSPTTILNSTFPNPTPKLLRNEEIKAHNRKNHRQATSPSIHEARLSTVYNTSYCLLQPLSLTSPFIRFKILKVKFQRLSLQSFLQNVKALHQRRKREMGSWY